MGKKDKDADKDKDKKKDEEKTLCKIKDDIELLKNWSRTPDISVKNAAGQPEMKRTSAKGRSFNQHSYFINERE